MTDVCVRVCRGESEGEGVKIKTISLSCSKWRDGSSRVLANFEFRFISKFLLAYCQFEIVINSFILY